jgi:hypothetical protein
MERVYIEWLANQIPTLAIRYQMVLWKTMDGKPWMNSKEWSRTHG